MCLFPFTENLFGGFVCFLFKKMILVCASLIAINHAVKDTVNDSILCQTWEEIVHSRWEEYWTYSLCICNSGFWPVALNWCLLGVKQEYKVFIEQIGILLASAGKKNDEAFVSPPSPVLILQHFVLLMPLLYLPRDKCAKAAPFLDWKPCRTTKQWWLVRVMGEGYENA